MFNVFSFFLVVASFSAAGWAAHRNLKLEEHCTGSLTTDVPEHPEDYFTIEEVLNELPPRGKFSAFTWYVNREAVLKLENIHVENGVIKTCQVLQGTLKLNDKHWQVDNEIFALTPSDSKGKENEYRVKPY